MKRSLALLDQRELLGQRLLDLDDHLGRAEHVARAVDDLGSGGLKRIIPDARAEAAATFDQDFVPVSNQCVNHRRYGSDPVFLRLDLFGDTDNHVVSSSWFTVAATQSSGRPGAERASDAPEPGKNSQILASSPTPHLRNAKPAVTFCTRRAHPVPVGPFARAISSVGRAPARHAGGHRFKSCIAQPPHSRRLGDFDPLEVIETAVSVDSARG